MNPSRVRGTRFIRTVAAIYGCQVCGETEPACMDFHHIDPSQKEADVNYMIKNKWSKTRIATELVKCVPLCANCHRKHHAGKLSEQEFKKLQPFSLQVIQDLLE